MILLLALGCAPVESEPIAPYDPLPWIDPIIGSGGVGAEIANVNPGATRPFGMVLLGPDTRSSYGAPGFYHCAGYHHVDTHVSGFSFTHAHGIGITDYGAVHVAFRADFDPSHTRAADRAAPFSHAEEHASPGLYRVRLGDDGTEIALTATERAGVVQASFPAGSAPVLWIDLAHSLGDDEVTDARIAVDGTRIVGSQRIRGGYSARFGGLGTHFAGTVSVAPVATGTWTDPAVPEPGPSELSATSGGLWLQFPEGTPAVELRLGISYVDSDGAWLNQGELADRDFDTLVVAAEEAWRSELANVRVRTDDEDVATIFHTALYHASLMPNVVSDADGRYRGLDQEVRTADHPVYSNLSLWDTFRTLHPWLLLARPQRQRDMLRSLVRMEQDGGDLPRWPMAHGYTSGMVGTPAVQVFAESALKGLDGWDVEQAYTAALAATEAPQVHAGRNDLEGYLSRGWVAADQTGAATSKTLEYAWTDASLAAWADARGEVDQAALLTSRSRGWRELWHDDFLTGRNADGSRVPAADPIVWDDRFYTEGNAWHYVWGAPLDADGMVELNGGVDALLLRLDAYWEEVYDEDDDVLPDDYYWHGNEPDLHYAYVAALAGEPEASAAPARWILANRYWPEPRGLDGNDDSGTLSAWYLFSALGIYPLAGTDQYALGSALVDRAEIDLEDGRTLVISAPDAATAVVPRRILAGDDVVDGGVIDHRTLLEGLHFEF